MHIAEGVLSTPVLVGGAAIAAVGVVYGLKKLREENLMFAGMLGAAFFVASLIHVPVGLGSAHLILNGLLGVFLRKAVFPVIFVSLLLQAVLFQFGGFTVLGVNTATMGLGAVAAGWLFQVLRSRTGVAAAGFVAGAAGVVFAGLLTALALALSNDSFLPMAVTIFLSNCVVVVAEGFITMFVVKYLARVKPDLLNGAQDKEVRK